MDSKLTNIYAQLLFQLCSKEYLAQKLNVSTKTIENKVKLANGDIVYSKRLGAYHFKNLLPNNITNNFLISLLINNVNNKNLKDDISSIKDDIVDSSNSLNLIPTKKFSEIFKNIIQLQIAINHNCILSIDYQNASSSQKEKKFIQANQISVINGSYYMYVTYDKKNKLNQGEKRTLHLHSISNINLIEYHKDDTFKTDVKGNAFGEFKNTNFAELTFKNKAASFIKRERLNSFHYEIIDESFDASSVNLKFYYNEEIEIIKIIQQWMPLVTFTRENDFSIKILGKIKDNFEKL